MRSPRNLFFIIGLTCVLVLSTACNNSDGNSVLGSAEGNGVSEGITLAADPAEIVLDPNDPEAPVDPDTGLLLGKTTIGAVVRDLALEPIAGAEVIFATSAGLLESEGLPVITDENGLATDVLAVDEDDVGDVEITATALEFTQMLIVPVILVPLNEPPMADAGEDQTVECPGPVTLDGSGSSDPDGEIELYEWLIGEDVIAEGAVVEVELPLGTTVVTLRVTDAAGATDSDDTSVTVQDTTPPEVSLHFSPDNLWPPNHRMVDIEATLDISDCDAEPTIMLVSVTSNEPDNANGDGNTEPDIMGADTGTADTHFQVRAERAGGGSGRIYTVTYDVTDAEGQTTTATGHVTVPHDQGH